MARDANDVLKQLIGDMAFQLATLVAANEALQAELAALKASPPPVKDDTI